uniref:Uncharacterized protein n=1 Tax=Salix viminalis TaxID=40686 RepID=A0A6N2L2S9_SALVM
MDKCKKTGRGTRLLGEQAFPTPAACISMKVPCLSGILEAIVLGIHVMVVYSGVILHAKAGQGQPCLQME